MAEIKTCTDCARPTNNQYANCPPRMADGRHFTDYRPRCVLQYNEKMSSYEQRMFLTQNADELMRANAQNAYLANRCGPCVEPYDQGTMVPEQTTQTCNDRTCTFNVTDPYGLGLGRNFYNEQTDTTARQRFLAEKEKEQAFFKSQQPPQPTQSYDRPAVPGGGKLY